MEKVGLIVKSPLYHKVYKDGSTPAYETPGAAGMDLRACIDADVVVEPGQRVKIPTGFGLDIRDPNIAAFIYPRSGVGANKGVVLGNLVGICDSDYQGEYIISVWNSSDKPFTIEPGMRICQLIFQRVEKFALEITENFAEKSHRGEGGFGSTGHK